MNRLQWSSHNILFLRITFKAVCMGQYIDSKKNNRTEDRLRHMWRPANSAHVFVTSISV